MKKVVLFLLVNGIGFGHFKRALVIADAFDKATYDVRFIVQASSTDIFINRGYKVYSFPLLYCIKHNNSREIIYNVLNTLVYKLSPSLVFEDTYPEDDYINLPAISNVPRFLIMRRADNQHLVNLLFDGYLSCYDSLFFMSDKNVVVDSINNIIAKNYLNYSPKCKFIGDIFDRSNAERIKRIRDKYNLSHYKKNIIFNCGAGGWHKGENVCRQVFDCGFEAVNNLVDEHPEYQFIFIAGPYSEWSLADSNQKPNIRVERYEDDLSSLLQVADICVIRPGYNSVMESLSGKSDIILLPSISYMEKQSEWSNQLVEDYGLSSVRIGDVDALRNTIIDCLNKSKRNLLGVKSNEDKIINYVTEYLNQLDKQNAECILSVTNNSFSNDAFGKLSPIDQCVVYDGVQYPIINMVSNPDYLKFIGKPVFVYNDENHEYESANSIIQKVDLYAYGIIPIDIFELKYITFDDAILKFHNVLSRGAVAINIVFEHAKDDKKIKFLDYIDQLISEERITIVSVNQIIQNQIPKRYSFGYDFHSIGIVGLE